MDSTEHSSFGASCVVDEISEIVPDLRVTLAEQVGNDGLEGEARPDATGTLASPGIQLSSEEPSKGKRRYEQVGMLGKGGLGEVLEVRDNDLRRLVALKRPREKRRSSSAVARLVLEAQVTAQLDHPNVPAVHELGVDDSGSPFFVMARIDGRSLQELLEARKTDPAVREQLTLSRTLRIVLQIAYALAYAHERGVVHRDVKPGNVFIGSFGQVYLMDWGIAKVRGRPDEAIDDPESPASVPEPVEAVAFKTRVNGFLGSVGYAAPEQIRGVDDIDGRADIYSLAALLYTMLAGRPPVVGESVHAMAAAAVLGDVTPLRRLAPVPETVAAVVHKGLAADRDNRYASIRQFIDDLEAVLEGRPVSVLKETQVKRFTRWYFGRPPWMFRMQTIDVDLLGAAWGAFGVAVGIWLGLWKGESMNVWAWGLVVVFALTISRPFYTMLRKPRADDPDALHVVGDLSTVSSTHDSKGGAVHPG